MLPKAFSVRLLSTAARTARDGCSKAFRYTIQYTTVLMFDLYRPPTSWVVAALESKELLALCLRRLKGLNKVRIIDASFIWTEPHSRRIRMKITIQQEAFVGTIIQQQFEVEFVVASQQCPGMQSLQNCACVLGVLC